MDIEILNYHAALGELTQAAKVLSLAMIRASDAAKRIDPDGKLPDDLVASRALDDCRDYLLNAIAKAPGMIQVFTGSKE